MENQKGKRERIIFVLGIVVASIIGFALNIYASLYYEVFILGTENFSIHNKAAVALPAIVLVYSYGLLSFLVYDYKNSIDINRPFFQRLFNYYENTFWPTKVTDRISRLFILVLKWSTVSLVGFTLFKTFGLNALLIWIVIIGLWQGGKYFYHRKKK